MEEVVISGPGYDPASTNVPGYTQEQLQSFIHGTNKGPIPEGAQSKANSWNRVTKVVRIQLRPCTPEADCLLLRTLADHLTLIPTAARREAQDESCIT